MNSGGISLTYQFSPSNGVTMVRAVGGFPKCPKLRTRWIAYDGAISLEVLKEELFGMISNPKGFGLGRKSI